MSPLPMNLQMDHSSSTESAHDQAESNRSKEGSGSKRRPSKIPLKSYTAPKPPGGKCTNLMPNFFFLGKSSCRCRSCCSGQANYFMWSRVSNGRCSLVVVGNLVFLLDLSPSEFKVFLFKKGMTIEQFQNKKNPWMNHFFYKKVNCNAKTTSILSKYTYRLKEIKSGNIIIKTALWV